LDPNAVARSVRFSLVWLSNAGFSIDVLMNSHTWFLTWGGLEGLAAVGGWWRLVVAVERGVLDRGVG
jgi:hypothetical protein